MELDARRAIAQGTRLAWRFKSLFEAPDATLAASYPTGGNVLNVGQIRRLRLIWQVLPILPTTPQLHRFQHHKFIIVAMVVQLPKIFFSLWK